MVCGGRSVHEKECKSKKKYLDELIKKYGLNKESEAIKEL